MSYANSTSSLWRPLGAMLGLLMLAGCAVPPVKGPGVAVPRPQSLPETFQLNGRLGVRYRDEGFSGNLLWRHGLQGDEISLSSPLGQSLARIERSPSGVVLETGEGREEADTAEELTERVLGWRLPLEGMRYWVLGLSAPGSPFSLDRDEAMNVTSLHQDGWDIEYQEFRPESGYLLPAKMKMRAKGVELRLVVDAWGLQ